MLRNTTLISTALQIWDQKLGMTWLHHTALKWNNLNMKEGLCHNNQGSCKFVSKKSHKIILIEGLKDNFRTECAKMSPTILESVQQYCFVWLPFYIWALLIVKWLNDVNYSSSLFLLPSNWTPRREILHLLPLVSDLIVFTKKQAHIQVTSPQEKIYALMKV